MKATTISFNAPARAPFAAPASTARGTGPSALARASEVSPPAPRLTPRQLEVLAWLCEGLPNKLIARRLDIAAATVKVHIACILRELGVASRLQAAILARELGLVGEPELSADPAPAWPGYGAQRPRHALAPAHL